MRLGFAAPDDLTAVLVDRENDGTVSRSATQSTWRGSRDRPAKAVGQSHVAADDEQVSFDVRRVARSLDDKAWRRQIAHIALFPDGLAGEAVELGQVAGHVIEVEITTVDRGSG